MRVITCIITAVHFATTSHATCTAQLSPQLTALCLRAEIARSVQVLLERSDLPRCSHVSHSHRVRGDFPTSVYRPYRVKLTCACNTYLHLQHVCVQENNSTSGQRTEQRNEQHSTAIESKYMFTYTSCLYPMTGHQHLLDLHDSH